MTHAFRGFKAILYKETLVVLRDPMTLFFMLFPPFIEMVFFGYALDTDVKHLSMLVLNEDRTVESRQVIDHFVNTQTFRMVGEVQSVDELSAEIRKGHAYVGVQIPPDFTRDLHAGRHAKLQVLIDGSSSTIANSALNTALAVSLRESIFQVLRETGRRDLPVEVRPQILFNPNMRSPNFFVPGVIGVVLQIATTFATAMAIVRERERGTLEQLFVSPLSRWGLMLGKLTPYLVIGMIMSTGLYAIMYWLFAVPIAGSLLLLMAVSLIYVFALLSMGLLISTRAQNQMQALQMSLVTVMPSVFFSGFIFPRETMPWIFQVIGDLLPATYFIELSRAIILRGAAFSDFAPSFAILTLMGLVLFALAAMRFRNRLA